MERDELIGRVHALAQEAKGGGELAAAGVLLLLCGALVVGAERGLLDACATFSASEIERLTGEPDWSEDVLAL